MLETKKLCKQNMTVTAPVSDFQGIMSIALRFQFLDQWYEADIDYGTINLGVLGLSYFFN